MDSPSMEASVIKPSQEPVAIIGMSGKMPQANDLPTFWENLINGKESIREVPTNRWNWQDYYGTSGINKTQAKWGGFLSDVDKFDAHFFGIPPKEAELMDPQHRLFLETAWNTIEDAGYRPSALAGKPISVFVGISTQDYRKHLDRLEMEIDLRTSTGIAVSMVANRLSHLLNFCGPSEISDTACSSALVAIHRGIQSLYEEGCEMALVGGVNLVLIPDGMISFDKAGMLSHEKEVRAFDQQAKGYVRGEGVGAVLLKPLTQAIQDRDSIYAVIRGSAINHGGRSYSLVAPNLKGQTDVMVKAYQNAGIAPETVGYLEAHGTATQAGDNIEIRAFKKAFAQLGYAKAPQKCKIGTVKTNIGHLESASGMASLFKIVFALKHRLKPGIKNFETPHPLLKLKSSPFYITNAHEAWKPNADFQGQELPRRASIHSFGFSGVNAHLVLEEWQEPTSFSSEEASGNKTFSCLMVLSAKNEHRLREAVSNLYRYAKSPPPWPSVAYPLQVGREAMEARLAFVVTGREELQRKLEQWQTGQVGEAEGFYHNLTETSSIDPNTSLEISLPLSIDDLASVAKHWVNGGNVTWERLYPPGTVHRLTGIPGYPFEKKYCWMTPHQAAQATHSAPDRGIQKTSLRQDNLVAHLKSLLHQVSGYDERELLEDQIFQEMGLDSLSLTALKNRLTYAFSLELSFEVLAEQNTLEKLANYLTQNFPEEVLFETTAPFPQTGSSSQILRSNTPPLAPLLDTYPVSEEQLRYWRNHQLSENTDFHQSLSIPICLEIHRKLDLLLFKKTLKLIINRQEVLRTVFQETPQGVRQQVLESLEPGLATWEIAKADHPTLTQTMEAFTQQPWDLEKGPLWRMGVVFQENKTVLLITMHHIIADLWSVQVFLNELSQIYSAWEHSKANPLPPLSHQYVDYAYQEETTASSSEWQNRKTYWQTLLQAPWEELALPFKKEKQRLIKNNVNQLIIPLDDTLVHQTQTFCQSQHLTPFTLYLSALNILLYGLTEQKRLIVGVPLQNREHQAWESLIGCFANVSFTVQEPNENQSLREVIEQVRQGVINTRKQALSFAETTALLQRQRQTPLCPVIQVMFNYTTTSKVLNRLFEAKTELVPLQRTFLDFDIALTWIAEDGKNRIHIEYAQNLFDKENIQQLGKQFEQVLSWMIRSPEAKLQSVFEQASLIRWKSIRIAATFVADPTQTSIQYWMDVLGERVHISFADFNQVFQELLNPSSLLRQNKYGINVLMLRISDWREASHDLPQITTEWIEALQTAVESAQTPYLVLIAPSSPHQKNISSKAIAEAEKQMVEAFVDQPKVTVIPPNQIDSWYPVESPYDEELDKLSSIPYQDIYFNALGTMIARHCFREWHSPYKVLVVDGDQTLWQGIVGEDGVEGIHLDVGRYQFQEQLIQLQSSGILLCLCSKNVETDILEVFEKRKDFPLKKEHFVALKVNWESKSTNLKSLATELNLSLEHFWFIDDSPLEIAEVQANAPEVLALPFPQAVDQIEAFVKHTWFFDPKPQTREDQHRTQWYRQNLKREHLKTSTLSYTEFLNELALQIQLSPMASQQMARVSQLTQRTNQFNSTTIRRSEPAIREMAQQTDCHIECIEVKDRFGDYGLVGAMIFQFTQEKAILDSLILSCRALGRGVEYQMLSKAGQIALDRGCTNLEVCYTPSARNQPIRDFLESVHHQSRETKEPKAIHNEEGFCFTMACDSLKTLRFSPASLPSLTNEPEPASLPAPLSTPKEGELTTYPIVQTKEWVQHWRQGADMIWLTKKIDETTKKHHVPQKGVAPVTETEHRLVAIWQSVLKLDSVGVETSLFELGSTSIELIQILAKTRTAFNSQLPFQLLIEKSTIRSMAQALENYQKTGQFYSSRDNKGPDLLKESILPENLKEQIQRLLNEQKAPRPTNKVFLTGSTGFLGAYLLQSLLENTSFVICCLVRAKDHSSGLQRIQENLASYNLTLDTKRIEVILGDLAQANFGLSEKDYQRLCEEVCQVFHNGALVHFVLPYEKLKPANVEGTLACLKLASTAFLKPIHYVSTASVFDAEGVDSEQTIHESVLPPETIHVYGGYAQSKWVSERLVTQAGEHGLPITIYRPNGIGPSLNPNHTRLNTDDVFSLVLLASLSIRKFFDLPLHIDFAPVDYIANAIVALSQKPKAGSVYSMTHPHPQTLAKLQEELSDLGENVELLPYTTWVTEIEHYAQVTNHQKLLTLLPLLQSPVNTQGESWLEMSAHRPQFDCTNTLHDLRDTGIECPEINSNTIMRLLLLSFLTNNYLESIQAIQPFPASITPLPHSSEKPPVVLSAQKTILILTWSLGSGHNASAEAIASMLQNDKAMEVEVVDLADWISFVRRLEPFWQHLSRHNIAQLATYTDVMQSSRQHEIVQFRTIYQKVVLQLMECYQPNTIISVCPLGCQLLRYFKEQLPTLKTITYVSDWFGGTYKDWADAGADWIYSPSPECTQFLIKTAEETEPEIENKIVTGSLIMRKGFNVSSLEQTRNQLRKAWGIGESEKVLLFNSYGDEKTIQLLQTIPPTHSLRVMVLCYNNPTILNQIEALSPHFPGKLKGRLWLDNIHEWLLVSDVLFSKPGPGICAEALMTQTVIFLNALAGVMPQEVSVYEKLQADHLGFGIESQTDFQEALKDWLTEQTRYQEIWQTVQQQYLQDGCEDFCSRL